MASDQSRSWCSQLPCRSACLAEKKTERATLATSRHYTTTYLRWAPLICMKISHFNSHQSDQSNILFFRSTKGARTPSWCRSSTRPLTPSWPPQSTWPSPLRSTGKNRFVLNLIAQWGASDGSTKRKTTTINLVRGGVEAFIDSIGWMRRDRRMEITIINRQFDRISVYEV